MYFFWAVAQKLWRTWSLLFQELRWYRTRSNPQIFPFNLPLISFTRVDLHFYWARCWVDLVPAPRSAVASSTCSPAPCQHEKLQRHPANPQEWRKRQEKQILCYQPQIHGGGTTTAKMARLPSISSSFWWPFPPSVCPMLFNEALFQLVNPRDLTPSAVITTGNASSVTQKPINSILCPKQSLVPSLFFPLFSSPISATFPSPWTSRCPESLSYQRTGIFFVVRFVKRENCPLNPKHVASLIDRVENSIPD